MNKKTTLMILTALAILALATLAHAASTMPWDDTLTKVKDALTGTTATTISILAVVGAGLGLAMGEGGGGAKKLLMVVMGIGVALGAAKLVAMFGGTAGCEIPVKAIITNVVKK